MCHIQGSANKVADALLQVKEVSQVSAPAIHFDQLAIAEHDNPELSELRSGLNSLKLKDISLPSYGNLLTCNLFNGTIRPESSQLRRSILTISSCSHTRVSELLNTC